MHITKLRTMALVEYQHDILFRQHLAQLFVLIPRGRLHQVREFLYCGDDDAHVVILQLFQQDTGRSVRVGTVLLEVVILLHGLIVQVFSIHHEEHLLDMVHPRSQLCCLE